MKQIKQTMVILLLVSAAFFYKAYTEQSIALALVGVLLVIIAIARLMVWQSLLKEEGKPAPDAIDFITRYMEKKPRLYAGMNVVYTRGNCDILYEENDGILLYDYALKMYYASAQSEAGAYDIVRLLPMDYGVVVAHEEVLLSTMKNQAPYAQCIETYNYIYEKRARYCVKESDIEFRLLDDTHMDIVMNTYSIQRLCTQEYMQPIIKAGMMGAFKEGELLGYIGMHDEGDIGLLEVFPTYRRQGIGTHLQCVYINYLLDQNYPEILFTQVQKNNAPSIRIQKKLSFIGSEDPTYFLLQK